MVDLGEIYEPGGYLDMGRIISAPYPFIVAVGWLSSSMSQCRVGYSYGELRIGLTEKSVMALSVSTFPFSAAS